MKLQIIINVDEDLLVKSEGFETMKELVEAYSQSSESIIIDIVKEIELLTLDYISIDEIKPITNAEIVPEAIKFEEELCSLEEIPIGIDLYEYFTDLLDEVYCGENEDDGYYFAQKYAEDENNLPDSGWTSNVYSKIGSREFELLIQFNTEWCGDWSVRANLFDGFKLHSVTEITK